MCGIAGFYNSSACYTANPEKWNRILTSMRAVLSHRGSDECGSYLSDCVGFAHARLAIRDLATGTQPIVRSFDGCEFAIVYNGELYNTEEIKKQLSDAGYVFETTTDTEVLLYAYHHFGRNFVQLLNGIFSFAIWDGYRRELFLARDRVGIKPLFYSFENGQLLFASEPKALFQFPGFVPKLTEDGMREVLAIGPARTAGNGVFEHVKEVVPGHFLIFHGADYTDHIYWDLFRTEHMDSYEQTVEKVSFLVRDSVSRQMISDVPVCTFLSGGLDSSIVTALASDYLSAHDEQLNTFSFDFKGNDHYFQSSAFQPEQDLPYVNLMLAHCPTNHTHLECDPDALFSMLYRAVDAKDMPGMTDVDGSLLYFCYQVSRQNKVALTGECADEIFGGYPWFYRAELLNRDGFPWAADMSVRTVFLQDSFIHDMDLDNYAYDRYLTSVHRAPHLASETPEEKKRYDIAYLNIKWFMQTLLDRMDRCSMYFGLEARVPFADHRIIEYVYNVPWEMKYQNGVEKALLRDACRDLLPPELIHRKKSPYPKTYHPRYEALLTTEMHRVMKDPASPILAFIDRKKLSAFLDAPKEYGQPWFGQLMAGPQLIAYFLQINYWMQKYGLSL